MSAPQKDVMPTTPDQTLEAERTRQRRNQVLDAASACFRLHGFHGCSMALLAKACGMSVGHIYHYFANKEAIIDAIVKRDLHECLQEVDQKRLANNAPQVQIQEVSRHVDEALDSENAALQFEILAEAARNPNVAETVHSAHLQSRAKFTELVALSSPHSTPEEIGSKVEVIGAIFDGLMVRAIRYPEIDKAKLVTTVHSALQHIIDL